MTKIKWLSPIRISALLLVLAYHFFRDIVPGGFIGVDVFFTLSGFLVTASITEEFRNSGNFMLFSFFKRRFLRIYPPLFLAVLFSLPFALMLSSDFTVNIGRQLAAAFGSVTNYFEILSGGSYEGRMLPHLYLHTWFLAVEVQLYFLWALFCAFFVFCLKITLRDKPETGFYVFKALILAASLAGAVFSYLRMQTVYAAAGPDPSAAYFDTFARAYPFLLGSATACFFSGIPEKDPIASVFLQKLLRVVMVAVMALSIVILYILSRSLTFSGEGAYRYGCAAASLLAVIMILCARLLHRLTPDISEPRLLGTAAALSYNIYLFHWPLYTVFFYTTLTYQFSFWNNNCAAVCSLLLSIGFSALVLYGLEPLFHLRLPLSNISIPALKRAVYAFISLFIITAVPLNGLIIARAPEISSLEEQLYTGYLYQDIDEIEQLKHLTEVINGNPLGLLGTNPSTGIIQNRVYTGNLSDPDYYELSRLPVSFNENGILIGVTIIGDSVCLGARRNLTVSIPDCYVDSEGSRQFFQGYNLMKALQNNDSLREYVVMALGTNQNNNSFEYIDRIIEDLRPGHRLIFVTPYNGAMNENWNTYKIMQYIRKLPALNNFVTVADWAELVEKQNHVLNADKIHIGGNPTAINLYTNCIIDAIYTAATRPAKW